MKLRACVLAETVDARLFELNGKDRDAANPFGSSENVSIREAALAVGNGPLSYRFPAHSVTVIEFTQDKR